MKENRIYSNLHVHTPHSFSFFSSIGELARQAAGEKVQILGINDFNTWDGFSEFSAECRKQNIFPSFGVEVMTLSREDKEEGNLANDPRNPGRIYLCGKGIPFPPPASEFAESLRDRVKRESSERMKEAVALLNVYLDGAGARFRILYDEIEKKTPSGWVRERHLAKDLSEKILGSKDPGAAAEMLGLSAASDDFAALQEAARSLLLKAGGPAYAPEDEGAFPSPDEAGKLFLSLGGFPAYPVLADGAGKFTQWEENPRELCGRLRELGYAAVEFIPHRNSLEVLLEYSRVFDDSGFAVTAGSEHNSPARRPLKPAARDASELPAELLDVFSRGAFCAVAHQKRKEKGLEGMVDSSGNPTGLSVRMLADEGENIIRRFFNHD